MGLDPRIAENIEAEANDVLKNLGDLDNLMLPVDVETLVDATGARLERVRFEDRSIAGAFMVQPPTILVDSGDSPERQAFTAAHELAHFLLHRGRMNGLNEVLYRQDVDSADEVSEEIENEANRFAASLLMPRKSVEKLWPLFKTEPDRMAKVFGVSKSAMYYRLRNLGLLGQA